MGKNIRFIVMLFIITVVLLTGFSEAPWTSPSQRGTTPKTMCDQSKKVSDTLNTKTATVTYSGNINGCRVKACPLSRKDLQELGSLPSGGYGFAGEGVKFFTVSCPSEVVISARICFPSPPNKYAAIFRLFDEDWVMHSTIAFYPKPGVREICTWGNLGSYTPVVVP